MRHVFLAAMGAVLLLVSAAAEAEPARIVLLRHGEKRDTYELCGLGMRRADALAAQMLGRGAAGAADLFGPAGRPDALMAITLHTLETLTPTATSWGMPVTLYAALPKPDAGKEQAEDEATRRAAREVMTSPLYAGKTVVMIWEHKRIASAKLDREHGADPVTLRRLLHLDALPGVPETWPDATYDMIWVIDYRPGSTVPSAFRQVRENFAVPFADLPAPEWGAPEPRHVAAGCLK